MTKRVFHSASVQNFDEGGLNFVAIGFGFIEELADEHSPRPAEPRWTTGMNIEPGADVETVASMLEAFARVLRNRHGAPASTETEG